MEGLACTDPGARTSIGGSENVQFIPTFDILRSASIRGYFNGGHLPLEVVFHWIPSLIGGRLPLKVN